MGRLAKLNGWQRLWVVGSVVALLWAAWWALGSAAETGARWEYKIAAGFDRKECAYVVRMQAGSKLEKEPEYRDPWDLYLYRSIYNDAASTKDGYSEHMSRLHRDRLVQFGILASVTWLLGIALVYGAGSIVAWVAKGFRQVQ